MHLVARYPGYILYGGKCRHITLYEIYMGVGGGASNMLKIRQKYRKTKGLLILIYFFRVPTSSFLQMVMCIS